MTNIDPLDPVLDTAIQQEMRGCYEDGYRTGLGSAAATANRNADQLRNAGVPSDHLAVVVLTELADAIRRISAEINFGGPR